MIDFPAIPGLSDACVAWSISRAAAIGSQGFGAEDAEGERYGKSATAAAVGVTDGSAEGKDEEHEAFGNTARPGCPAASGQGAWGDVDEAAADWGACK